MIPKNVSLLPHPTLPIIFKTRKLVLECMCQFLDRIIIIIESVLRKEALIFHTKLDKAEMLLVLRYLD